MLSDHVELSTSRSAFHGCKEDIIYFLIKFAYMWVPKNYEDTPKKFACEPLSISSFSFFLYVCLINSTWWMWSHQGGSVLSTWRKPLSLFPVNFLALYAFLLNLKAPIFWVTTQLCTDFFQLQSILLTSECSVWKIVTSSSNWCKEMYT